MVGPDGARSVLDFREIAPEQASRDMFVEAASDGASRIGGLANAVPGEARGLEALHKRYGKLAWSKVVAPARTLALDGFELGENVASII